MLGMTNMMVNGRVELERHPSVCFPSGASLNQAPTIGKEASTALKITQ
jgi:hypothetical protein